MKLLLIGGGTGGPTTTLFAIAEYFQRRHSEVEYLCVSDSSETTRKIAGEARIPLVTISAGKLRRYWSMKNIADIGRVGAGFIQTQGILRRFQPNGVISCGSYVTPPVAIAAWARNIPIYIHQQDVWPGLANRFSKFFSKKITVAFPESLKYFPSRKTTYTGNPVRSAILQGEKERGYKSFSLRKDLPTLFVVGGGTGALGLNQCIEKAASKLLAFIQILHVTGKGKSVKIEHENYHAKTFLTLTMMADALQVADVIISRAGLGAITECAAVRKAPMLVPLPNSHQVMNAQVLAKKEAVEYLPQEEITPIPLAKKIQNILANKAEVQKMGKRLYELLQPEEAGKRIVEILETMI